MLQNQLARGNNGLIKTKYLTFSIEADSIRSAKPRLERIETDVLNNFKRLGVAAEVLDGKARLAQLHAIFHMDEQAPFQFEWDWLAPSGLSTKDFIAPSGFEFRTGKQFCMGKKYGAVSFVQILAPELNDRMLADFLDMESSLIVNLHIQSVDQVKAIKTVKRKITDLDRSKIEEQKKAVRAGYDTVSYTHLRIIVPVQAEYLPAKGLEQLLSTISKVKRQLNPKLQIDGILLTMVDSRTNFAKEIAALLRETYGSKIKVFGKMCIRDSAKCA